MTKKLLPPVHPGEILLEEFMKPYGISQYKLAKALHIAPIRVSEIVRGKRAISADTALRLGRFFEVEAKFWMNLQANYELEKALQQAKTNYQAIEPLDDAA